MDKELKGLFNFQHFQGNDKLNKVISATLDRYGMEEIELDDLDMVNAAGNANLGKTLGPSDKERVETPWGDASI